MTNRHFQTGFATPSTRPAMPFGFGPSLPESRRSDEQFESPHDMMKMVGHKLVLDVALGEEKTTGYYSGQALLHFVEAIAYYLETEKSPSFGPVLEAFRSAVKYFDIFANPRFSPFLPSTANWELLLKDWNNHQLIILPIGFKEHAMAMMFVKMPDGKKFAAYINVGLSLNKASGANNADRFALLKPQKDKVNFGLKLLLDSPIIIKWKLI